MKKRRNETLVTRRFLGAMDAIDKMRQVGHHFYSNVDLERMAILIAFRLYETKWNIKIAIKGWQDGMYINNDDGDRRMTQSSTKTILIVRGCW